MNNILLDKLTTRHPSLISCKKDIKDTCNLLIELYKNEGKLLVCGNGGSSSDADHIVGELMKSFAKKRTLDKATIDKLNTISTERGTLLSNKLENALSAISLTAHSSLVSAVTNDVGGDYVFAQQIIGYGNLDDTLLCITTSGNSQNIINAAITAKAKGLTVIGLTGNTGGKLKQYCDITICAPSLITPEIQELHLPIYHTICEVLEDYFF